MTIDSCIIVGGGLVGLATAMRLKKAAPHCAVFLLEKESCVGAHQSTHNSGVLHAGLYYKPGSLKAQLAVSGIRQMTEFCREQNVHHEICGKVVVAIDAAEVDRLKALFDRGTRNGLRGLRWLSGNELREIEPHAAGIAAVHVPEEGIVDYAGVCMAMHRELTRLGVDVKTSARVMALRQEAAGWRVASSAGDWHADFIVNCAGLHCDRIARLAGATDVPKIVPFRGEYHRLRPSAQQLVRNLIYPVPDPTYPFLGVHFTRLIAGGIEAGPNAVLAFAREGYTKWKIDVRDLADAATCRGLWRFMGRNAGMVWAELRRSFSRRMFCAALQKLVPELQESDLEIGGAGVRAQALLTDGTLVQDFHLIEGPRALHVLNAPSPAATASIAIGQHIAHRVLEQR